MRYVASPTAKQFHKDTSLVRIIMGPVQSGKTSICLAEIMLQASRAYNPVVFAVVSATQEDSLNAFNLVATLVAGITSKSPLSVTFNNVTLLFVQSVANLRLTGAWVTDARDVSQATVNNVINRVGLQPGLPPFVILDTLPFSTTHWLYRRSKGPNWTLFQQPSGLSQEAENIDNLPPGYYQRLATSRSAAWVRVYVHGEYGNADYFDDETDDDSSAPDITLAAVDISEEYIMEKLSTSLVKQLAKVGLTRNEVLDGFSLTWEDLDESAQLLFTRSFNFGRMLGLQQMSEAIFAQGLTKTGSKEAIQYLQKFSAEWRSQLAEMPKIDGITIDWVQ